MPLAAGKVTTTLPLLPSMRTVLSAAATVALAVIVLILVAIGPATCRVELGEVVPTPTFPEAPAIREILPLESVVKVILPVPVGAREIPPVPAGARVIPPAPEEEKVKEEVPKLAPKMPVVRMALIS